MCGMDEFVSVASLRKVEVNENGQIGLSAGKSIQRMVLRKHVETSATRRESRAERQSWATRCEVNARRNYSARKASMGSTVAARREGK
jgi:hypothetical protein